MKKKCVLPLLAVGLLLFSALPLQVCAEEHSHLIVHVDAVAPTCTEEGIVEHFHCVDCGKAFSGIDCAEELTVIEIPVLEHTPGDWQIGTEPTALLPGNRVKICTACGEVVEMEVLPALGDEESSKPEESSVPAESEAASKAGTSKKVVETKNDPFPVGLAVGLGVGSFLLGAAFTFVLKLVRGRG